MHVTGNTLRQGDSPHFLWGKHLQCITKHVWVTPKILLFFGWILISCTQSCWHVEFSPIKKASVVHASVTYCFSFMIIKTHLKKNHVPISWAWLGYYLYITFLHDACHKNHDAIGQCKSHVSIHCYFTKLNLKKMGSF